jgi:hypothetical protein
MRASRVNPTCVDRQGLRRSRISDAPLRIALALHRIRDTDRRLAFPAHDVKQPISFPRRISAPGFCDFASLTPNEGWAERRETFGCVRSTRWACHSASQTRVNALMTRHARRLARRLASRNAGRSPLGAPPWRFWASGPRFRHRHCLRIRAASSSQPGRSAWRATSRASRGQRLRAAAAGRHASLRLRDRL